MGLTNYLKNKPKTPPHNQSIKRHKTRRNQTYQYAKSSKQPYIRQNWKSLARDSKGIDQGAGLFNNSLGFGPDVDIGFGYPESRPKISIKHRRNANTIIIRHEYPGLIADTNNTTDLSRRHRKNWQLGDI